MNNIFLISSPDSFYINKEIEKIIKNAKGSEIIKYDLKEVLIDRVIEDLDTINFLSDKKVIIAFNAYFLSSEVVKEKLEHNIDLLTKYINNPNPDNILVLVCDKLNERKNIVKLLKEKAKVLEGNVDINKVLSDNSEDYIIEDSVKKYLIEYCNNDYYRIINEFEKLKLFKFEDKIILKDDIDSFVSKTIDDNIFSLVDAIINKDKKKAFEIYEDLILKNEEPIKILIVLANKIRLLYQVKVLYRYSNEEIAKIIGSHVYPVKLAKSLVNKYSEDDLISILYRLGELDIDIKKGNTYKNIAFELLILSL